MTVVSVFLAQITTVLSINQKMIQPYVCSTNINIVSISILRMRQVTCASHTKSKWRMWDLNLGSLIPESTLSSSMFLSLVTKKHPTLKKEEGYHFQGNHSVVTVDSLGVSSGVLRFSLNCF